MGTAPGSAGGDRGLDPGHAVGEYVIESQIGAGGFGTVYRARHPLIGKLAAVKVLARQYSADPEIVSRFVDEARAVNQIRHRNIIDIFAFGQLDDDRSYYVMELLDGQPLDEVIDERGALPLGEAIPILRGIARALDAAHASGVAHRDLKPENVFLARDSDGAAFPKLLDFGIAKLFGDRAAEQQHKTRTGAPMGTPYYMSPEQCRGRDVDHRTDIYAFGCVAYKMLTGDVPFDGEAHMDVLMAQIGEEPVPPSERMPLLPPAVDDVIAWMMRKEPAERPPDLRTAVGALEAAAEAAGIPFAGGGQRTPSAVTPVPVRVATPRRAGATAVGTAPTMTPITVGLRGPGLAEPRGRSRWILGGAVVAAAIGGAILAVMLMSGGDEPPPVAAPIEAAPPPVVAPPAAEVLPALVNITVAGPPEGTEVYGPAGPLGAAPGTIQVVRGSDELQLVFKAEGHDTAIVRVTPDGDKAIDVQLTAKPVVAGKPPPAKKPPAKKPPVKKPPPTVVDKPPTRPVTDPFGRK